MTGQGIEFTAPNTVYVETAFMLSFRVVIGLRPTHGAVIPGGTMRNVDMKRLEKNEKKIGIWRWRHNPFFGSREFNGLRVMMALLNNWDHGHNGKFQNSSLVVVRNPKHE